MGGFFTGVLVFWWDGRGSCNGRGCQIAGYRVLIQVVEGSKASGALYLGNIGVHTAKGSCGDCTVKAVIRSSPASHDDKVKYVSKASAI